ncbi:SIS domain-containing protein [Robertmurraya andreesenii]|uniref:Phosphosugar-binding protein n=1 Tax=Anoxybacillus andreesenii TaxID=1325932 RepID=A0ABT9V3K9_9BACL|nr:SIS domain-containing protein [Robertmurraya andreesenii]MDQ0155517.1 putative phosphosugar-binding protein [Robertmurraya andreesenii]
MFKQYFHALKDLLDTVEKDEKDSIQKAAQMISSCIQEDGIVHVFGCGHSHLLAEELFYRAGGLAPISPILIEDLMLHKGAVRSSQLEKDDDFAEVVMANMTIQPKVGDTLMEHPSLDVPFGSGSTVIGTAIVNGIMVETINIMVDKGINPPVLKSGNVDGAEEHNRRLVTHYKGRIPMLED